ncbi:hypothetical protein CfE428DRAFT_0185 [Chthoniobacter flavus Ellin428]|uniref:PBS lyase HEAT domain protein repeat-containing protein n=1 Tax=Chthoniobacter flavus Ellin428 TaxID=497964 RepID=B4CU22_9BACT|nr:HEAT repeat domain-containing protein [Chthoniobacter flavus]EDY22060.1 hypothetical protein CfE428DRAFT_0185 [Chthoniobacter flavus Ellin428]
MGRTFPRAFTAGLAASLLATCVLAQDTPPASVDKLVQQLTSRDLPARREAAYELSHLGKAAKPALPALIKALEDDDKQVWSSAIAGIAALGPEGTGGDSRCSSDQLDGTQRGGRGRQRDMRQGVDAHGLTRSRAWGNRRCSRSSMRWPRTTRL